MAGATAAKSAAAGSTAGSFGTVSWIAAAEQHAAQTLHSASRTVRTCRLQPFVGSRFPGMTVLGGRVRLRVEMLRVVRYACVMGRCSGGRLIAMIWAAEDHGRRHDALRGQREGQQPDQQRPSHAKHPVSLTQQTLGLVRPRNPRWLSAHITARDHMDIDRSHATAFRRTPVPAQLRPAATGSLLARTSRIGHSGRSSPWQQCTRCSKRALHGQQLLRLCVFERLIWTSAMAFDQAARPLAGLCQAQQLTDLVDRKAQVTRLADEAQRGPRCRCTGGTLIPSASVRASTRRPVVPDHLGRHARGGGGPA